jgi:predicted dienelactone hydrolase
MGRSFLLVSLLLGLTVGVTAAESPKGPPPVEKVGVATRIFVPKAQRNWRGAARHQLTCIVWYPAIETAVETEQIIGPPDAPLFLEGKAAPGAEFSNAPDRRPLVVLSHGTGGSAAQMAWLGIALARAGIVAVAVNHPGNNALEPYTPEGFTLWWERATDLSEVIDAMLTDPDFGPHIEQRSIGAAGFSLGGYTVLELAGAQTDMLALVQDCKDHPANEACHVPESSTLGSGETMLSAVRKTSGESLARAADSFRDPRIKSVFALAPAITVAQTDESLHSIRIPLEVVVGNADPIAPPANADKISADDRGARAFVLPGGVAHYTFLDVCAPAGKQSLPGFCADNPGVDREAVHTQVETMAIDFFDKTLRWR